MSLMIKGMEMPKSCHCCRMCFQVADGDIDWHWECCLLYEKVERYAADRIPGCPLIPIPPHRRLVDADALEAEFEKLIVQDNWYYNALHHAPTIIPAEEGEI